MSNKTRLPITNNSEEVQSIIIEPSGWAVNLDPRSQCCFDVQIDDKFELIYLKDNLLGIYSAGDVIYINSDGVESEVQ